LTESAMAAVQSRKRGRVAEGALSLAKELGVATPGNGLENWGDDELRGLNMEVAVGMGMPAPKAARLVAKIGALKEDEADIRLLNRELWSLCRKGYRTHRGVLWTSKESLVSDVDLVLRNGANVNSTDMMGDTALHGACAKGHKDIIALLLQWGADCCIRNNDGKVAPVKGMRALHAVATRGQKDTVLAILSGGCSCDEKDELGQTPIHIAAKNGRTDLVQCFIDHGGSLNVHDKRGRTPLHWAASEGHTACTLLLIEKGADVNAKTQAGTTALHWVAVQGCVDTAQLLIKNGADVNARNNDGYTPYDRANHAPMKKLLKEAGGIQSLGWWDLH